MKNYLIIISLISNIILLLLLLNLKLRSNFADYIYPNRKAKQQMIIYNRKIDLFKALPYDTAEIIFMGDSHINSFAIDAYFEGKTINMGIGGDCIIGLYNRIDLALDRNPKKIIIEIGTNDIYNNLANDTLLYYYELLIKKCIQKISPSNIYICNIFPRNNKELNNKIEALNALLMALSDSYKLNYIDVFTRFCNNGILKTEYDCGDGLHLSGNGYIMWANNLKPYVNCK